MKLVKHFDNFLSDTVNLNQTRIDRLNGHVDAIENFISNSDYAAPIKDFSSQGSWAHKTIIKPLANKNFDADLVMFIKPVEGWDPEDYIQNLYQVFKDSSGYSDKVSRNTRCVTLDYAGDFCLDIVPCIVRPQLFAEDRYEVCNRKDNVFEETDPEGYTKWLTERNAWTGNNMLRKVTRLLKYLRDHKTSFSAKSILLTTILGKRIDAFDLLVDFPDVPTSLQKIIGRVDEFLQENPVMPVIKNPVLDSEDFNRHWTQEKYDNFRSKIHQYREWIDDAYVEKSRDESIRKWRRVFGDNFAKGEVVEKAASVKTFVLSESMSTHDIVSGVRAFGASILAKIPTTLPHVQAPKWKNSTNNFPVHVRAYVCNEKGGIKIRSFVSGEVLAPGLWLRFEAWPKSGLPFPEKGFLISWRVVNTDRAAVAADALRGDFYKSDSPGLRWEITEYHGAHWVEAFVISKRKNQIVGKSERFFVVVENAVGSNSLATTRNLK